MSNIPDIKDIAFVHPWEPEPSLIPVEPVFACLDQRAAWDKRKRYLVKMITAFDKERLPDTGTTELTRFLQDMTVPENVLVS